MAKHDRRKRSSQPPRSQTVTIQVPLPVLGVLNGVRAAFHGLCIETGMQVVQAMVEGDREDLCGPKGRHRVERPAWRGGSVSSAVTLGGRQVACNVVKHKLRNVTGHLPERLHASVGKALRDAWDLDSADRAARVLERLAGSLERDHPGAAASIREGLEETLTVQRLGLTGALERTLRSTNIIENLMDSVEGYTRRVKRWRGGQMIQRWVASALVEAEPRFRRVRGYRDLRYLVAALDALAPPDRAVADVP